MAALSDPRSIPHAGELMDLRGIPAGRLEPFLEEETAAWLRELD